LARSAGDFIAQSSPVARLRALRDQKDERGYSLPIYKQLADLGFFGIPFSEADGGAGLGLAELVLVTEAMGRGLAPEPLIPSVVLSGRALAQAGSTQQKAEWLTPLIAGEKVLATAYTAPKGRYDLTRAPFRAERAGSGFKLTGQAAHVWGGQLADGLIVAARTSGSDGDTRGLTLFVVPAGTRGLGTKRQVRVDSLNAAIVTLEGVELRADHVLGKIDEGHPILARAIDDATVALSGEMLGGMNEAFNRTRVYMKERRQFGVAIGTFQALKHRAARLFVELELSRSAVMGAARAIDEGSPEAARLVSVAKARVSDAYTLVANEAVQIHAGIGMTDEHEIGFFIKRARASELTFGDAGFHRDRFASLAGF
ncbi:MAG TPA: acyl-CoA dehydrogenase family protein, partial [Polyangiales bacterium]